MEATIQNGGWIAVIVYLFLKDAIIPVIRKSIPAKVKGDIKSEAESQKHAFVMEQKKLDAELATQTSLRESIAKLADTQVTQAATQAAQAEISRVQNDTLIRLETGQREILDRLPKTRKAGK